MKYEKSCGAIIVNDKLEVLLLKHNAGHWAFPKGHVEGSETEEETALREAKEETNLTIKLDTKFRATSKYSPVEGVEKEVIYFMGYDVKGNEKVQLEEVSQIKWKQIDDAIEFVTFANDKEILKKAKKYLELNERK